MRLLFNQALLRNFNILEKLKKIQLPLKLLISIGIISVIALRLDVDHFIEVSKQVEISIWGYALIFVVIQFLLLSLRWKILINIGQERMDFVQSVQVTIASLLANFLFITTISGIVVRVALALQYGASIFKAICATIADRFMTLFALLVFSSLFLPSLSVYLDNALYKNVSIYVGVVTFFLLVFTPLFIWVLINNAKNLPNSLSKHISGTRYLRILLSDYILIGKTIAVSLIAQLCFFVAVYFLCLSAHVELSFLQIMTILPIVSLIASLPISIGGWGVREGAYVFGFGLLGVSIETAFLISIQIGLIGMIATIIMGIPSIIADKNILQAQENVK